MREDSQALATMHDDSQGMRDASSTWGVSEDPETRVVVMRLPKHVTANTVKAAISAVADRLVAGRQRVRVVADLRDVRSFDLAAPLVAVMTAAPITALVSELEIVASNKLVRVAATSAAAVLGVRYIVRPPEAC